MILSLRVSLSSSSSAEVDMGTTILAVPYDGGVVVGADSRTSASGYVSNRFAVKIDFLLDAAADDDDEDVALVFGDDEDDVARSTCCVCRSGSAADTQRAAEDVREELRAMTWSATHRSPTVSHAAHALRNRLRSDPELSCGLVVAGYDHVAKRGVAYSITKGGALAEEPRVAAAGSGSTYVLGLLDDRLSRDAVPPPTEEEAVALVQRALALAAARDGGSGGSARIFAMDRRGARDLSSSSRRDGKGRPPPFVASARERGSARLVDFAPPVARDDARPRE